eukprot:m.285260 g.285260  ORF g.285260 m.285260 type:complete len:356 (-) comp17772_c0_seq1:9358-10425(-)
MSYMQHFVPEASPTVLAEAILDLDDVGSFSTAAIDYETIVRAPTSGDNSSSLEAHKAGPYRSSLRKPKRAKRQPSLLSTDVKCLLLRAAADGRIKPFQKHHDIIQHQHLTFTDDYGWTCLMVAAGDGHLDLLQHLTTVFSSTCLATAATDRSGRDAVAIAQQAGHVDVAAHLQHLLSLQAQREATPKALSSQAMAAAAVPTESMQATASNPAWFCDVCQAVVGDDSKTHTVSIVHNVKCHHAVTPHPFHLQASNRGYQLMKKAGWDELSGLGPNHDGRKAPVKTVLKRARDGLGTVNSKGEPLAKPRVTHFKAHDPKAVVFNPRTVPKVSLNKREAVKHAKADRAKDRDLRHLLA